MIIQETLPNGIRIVAQKMEQVRSCAIGVWVGTGSVNELGGEGGISHFIEHMLFKGTERRSAQQIAVEMDGIGGNINAFTGKECTCFYCKVLDEHIPLAVDVLSDLVLHSRLDPEEIKKEQGVVCEEILMVEDSPEDLVHETASAVYYQEDALAKPILGTEESVRSFTRETLQAYMARQYAPERIVIAAAGNFEKEALLQEIREKFSGMQAAAAPAAPTSRAPGGKRFLGVEKDIEQVHICMTLPGVALDTQEQYPLLVLSNVLGGSMSSRLFQKIREQRGLAYSIYSYPSCYRSDGCFSLYAGTGEQQAGEVLQLMLEELALVRAEGITEQEFLRSRDQLKGGYVMGQEGTSSRMNALGKTQLLLNRLYSEEHTIRRIESVSMEAINRILPRVLDVENGITVCVGKVGRQEDSFRKLLKI